MVAEKKVRDKAEIKENADRYKVLFDFYKGEYDALRNDYYKVEDKAAKYLTSLSVLSGVLLVLFKEVVSDFQLSILSSIKIVVLCVLVLSLSAAWRFIFMTLKTIQIKTFPYNQEGIDYFNEIDLDTFYYSMSISYVDLIKSYKDAIETKTQFLNRAFSEIKFSGLGLLFFLTIYFVDNIFLS
ncbi:hypothetical protein EGT62_09200 [Acinetobacter junii]|nr:hypothetical protein EGT62_09200 [Acinetobacter junii]